MLISNAYVESQFVECHAECRNSVYYSVVMMSVIVTNVIEPSEGLLQGTNALLLRLIYIGGV